MVVNHFLFSSNGLLPRVKQLLYCNLLAEVRGVVRQGLERMLATFQGHRETGDRLMPYHFYSSAANHGLLSQRQLQHKAGVNPISLEGRIRLLEGVLQTPDVSGWFRVELPTVLVQSLCNVLYPHFRVREELVRPGVPWVEVSVNGGLALLEDNPLDLSRVVREFISS
jgi:hypothetical protein